MYLINWHIYIYYKEADSCVYMQKRLHSQFWQMPVLQSSRTSVKWVRFKSTFFWIGEDSERFNFALDYLNLIMPSLIFLLQALSYISWWTLYFEYCQLLLCDGCAIFAEMMVSLSHLHLSTSKFDMKSCTLLLLTTDLGLLSLGNINIDRMMKESEEDVIMRQTISHILIGHL